MRVFLAFGLLCCCAALLGADLKAAATESDPSPDKNKKAKPACDDPNASTSENPPKIDPNQICDLLNCIGANINAPDFKCKIMAVNPNKVADAFEIRDWYPLGQADVTPENWPVVREATWAVFTEDDSHRREWYSPAVGLGFAFAKDCKAYTAGQYVLLMFFDTQSAELYYKKSADKAAKLFWKSRIQDTRPWRDILTNAGISLTPKTASSN